MLASVAVLTLLLSACYASPVTSDLGAQRPLAADVTIATTKGHRPLVIWHGLGDTAHADGISEFIQDIKDQYPGIYVHSVQIPEGGSADEERRAGFFGKVEDQAEEGCQQIASIPELADGFDAMGFSQGGLYLRSYAQFCNNPPVRNLITFGTPHYGISALLPCPTPPTLQCLLAARAARAGIYTDWAQNHLVSAQYYRDVERLDEYYDKNTFLTRMNNETSAGGRFLHLFKGVEGSGRVDSLDNFVAVMFDADKTVSPAQSAHFWTYLPSNKSVLLPLPDQPLYQQDWIGLRALDKRGRLHLEHCPGEHMDLGSGDCAKRMVDKWVGGRWSSLRGGKSIAPFW